MFRCFSIVKAKLHGQAKDSNGPGQTAWNAWQQMQSHCKRTPPHEMQMQCNKVAIYERRQPHKRNADAMQTKAATNATKVATASRSCFLMAFIWGGIGQVTSPTPWVADSSLFRWDEASSLFERFLGFCPKFDVLLQQDEQFTFVAFSSSGFVELLLHLLGLGTHDPHVGDDWL